MNNTEEGKTKEFNQEKNRRLSRVVFRNIITQVKRVLTLSHISFLNLICNATF